MLESRKSSEAVQRKPEKFNPQQLSDLGQYAYQKFIDATKESADPFFQDLNSTDPDMGIMSKSKALGKERINLVQAQTARHFHRLVDQIAINYKKRLFKLDAIYREKLKSLEGTGNGAQDRIELQRKFQDQFLDLAKECATSVDQLRESITGLARQIGGPNEFLDSNEEIDRWARHVLPLLKGLNVDEVKLGKGGIDVGFAGGQYARSFELMEKLGKGEKFNQGDYEKVFGMMMPFMDKRFDRKNENATRATSRMLENSGALMIVEAMNPEQRFQLAEAWMVHPDRNPMQKRQGLLFLAAANYLNLRQTDVLMRRLDSANPDQYALRQEEWKELEATQAMVKTVRAQAIKAIGENPDRSLVGEHFTASNAMFYEVIGRVALVGTGISTALAAKRAVSSGDPTQFTQTLLSPIYLAGVATVGVTYEHVTGKGNLGEGSISQMFASMQTKGRESEDPTARTERLKKERLRETMGNNVETVAFLKANKGVNLALIMELAEKEDKPEEYRFSFSDLSHDRAQKNLPKNEYHGLDYRTLKETENQITTLFQQLYVDFGLQKAEDMLRLLAEVDREMGFKTTI